MTPDTAAERAEAITAFNGARLSLARRLRTVMIPAGSRGDYPHDIVIVATVDGQEITEHNYGSGPELQCACDGYDVSRRSCAHIRLYELALKLKNEPAAVPA